VSGAVGGVAPDADATSFAFDRSHFPTEMRMNRFVTARRLSNAFRACLIFTPR
jgi:hypothetical protein